MLLEKTKSSMLSASHHEWGPAVRLRVPGGVQGQRPSLGPGDRAPGSSGVLPILNASGELSWALFNTLFIMHIYDKKKKKKHNIDYKQIMLGGEEKKIMT